MQTQPHQNSNVERWQWNLRQVSTLAQSHYTHWQEQQQQQQRHQQQNRWLQNRSRNVKCARSVCIPCNIYCAMFILSAYGLQIYAEPIENMLIWLGARLFQKHKTFTRRYYHRLSPSLPRQVYRQQYQNLPPLHNTQPIDVWSKHRVFIASPAISLHFPLFLLNVSAPPPSPPPPSSATVHFHRMHSQRGMLIQLICRRQIFAQRIDFRIGIIEKFNRQHRQYEFYDFPPLCNHAVYRLTSWLSNSLESCNEQVPNSTFSKEQKLENLLPLNGLDSFTYNTLLNFNKNSLTSWNFIRFLGNVLHRIHCCLFYIGIESE